MQQWFELMISELLSEQVHDFDRLSEAAPDLVRLFGLELVEEQLNVEVSVDKLVASKMCCEYKCA